VIDRTSAANVLGRSAYWAGARVGSLPLTAIERVDASTHSAFPESAGNQIRHTTASDSPTAGISTSALTRLPRRGGPFLAIGEAADYHYLLSSFNFDNAANAGMPLATGEVPLSPDGEAVMTESGRSTFTSLQMRRDGLYIVR
jgi:hypothetical protein